MSEKEKIFGRYWMCDVKARRSCPSPEEVIEAAKLIGERKSFKAQVLHFRHDDFPKEAKIPKNITFVAVTPPHAPRNLVIEDIEESYGNIPAWKPGEYIDNLDEDPLGIYRYLEHESHIKK